MTQQLLVAGQEFGGRYRIERFLAEGGFGAVYVAEQLATEAHVALKVLWPQVLGSKDAVEKFEQEARIAGRVNSEHIVRVIDAGFDEGTQMPFLVMELLEGEDLNSLVERQGPLSPDLVVEYLRQVASALDKAHGYTDRNGERRAIVHRDLKPENIFLSRRENGEPLVKVLDFGIAKVTSSTSNVSREMKGTPLYMAFEQAAGAAITPQTDVWPLGLIAFFLLSGVSYWRAAHAAEGSLAQLFGEVLSLPLDPPSQRLAELGRPGMLPAGFDAWFARCVNRDASQRYATAGEAVVMLGDVYGIAVQAVGSRPTSQVVATTTPSSLAVPTHATPMPSPLQGGTPVQASAQALSLEASRGETMHSAAQPAIAATQGALSVTGPAPTKRGSAVIVVAAIGAVTLIGGIAAVAFAASHRGETSADTAASGAESALPAQSPSSVSAPPTTSEPSAVVPASSVPEAGATPPAQPEPPATARAGATPPKTQTKPTATAKETAAPVVQPPPTATQKPKQNVYDDR